MFLAPKLRVVLSSDPESSHNVSVLNVSYMSYEAKYTHHAANQYIQILNMQLSDLKRPIHIILCAYLWTFIEVYKYF